METSLYLGSSIPPWEPHAISVSLPTWRDVVGYEEGEKRVLDSMETGYPRFFIHKCTQKLSHICEQKFGTSGERCLLCPTYKIADACRSFMIRRSSESGESVPVRLVQFLICPEDKHEVVGCNGQPRAHSQTSCMELHIVLFPSDAFPLAKQFWQHTGLGISSRMAERCLSLLPCQEADLISPPVSPSKPTRAPLKPRNRHYTVKSDSDSSPIDSRFPHSPSIHEIEVLSADQGVYLEERYGRNLPLTLATSAKTALRRRIAGVLVRDVTNDCPAVSSNVVLGPSSRGIASVTEDDVYLFPTGMSAIWQAHQLALAVRPPAKSVCFGFPYTDTLKILEKWGPGCHFLGHGLDSDIDELELIIASHDPASGTPPILALFTEFPSNPLLRCGDLPRLRALADKHDFLIVVDETLGNFVNVEVLPYADIVVSSLSKIFSGDANVLGGSLVLNPARRHYAALKQNMSSSYQETYFDADGIYLERNSRNFEARIRTIDATTETLCDFLHSRSLVGRESEGGSPPITPIVIKEVFYPKWITRQHYDRCRISGGGFGGLFSLTFTSMVAARAFFDTLQCHKGPSLGTNFTLTCPYSILAHYVELDWAAQYGVEDTLVRVSVGLEDAETLLKSFQLALDAAENAVKAVTP